MGKSSNRQISVVNWKARTSERAHPMRRYPPRLELGELPLKHSQRKTACRVAGVIIAESEKAGVDPFVLAGLIYEESRFSTGRRKAGQGHVGSIRAPRVCRGLMLGAFPCSHVYSDWTCHAEQNGASTPLTTAET